VLDAVPPDRQRLLQDRRRLVDAHVDPLPQRVHAGEFRAQHLLLQDGDRLAGGSHPPAAYDHGEAHDHGTAYDHGEAHDYGTAYDHGEAHDYGTAYDHGEAHDDDGAAALS
jgi:hypothetical protein